MDEQSKINELYRKKGELITTIESSQAILRYVNEEIVKELNAANRPQVGGEHKSANAEV